MNKYGTYAFVSDYNDKFPGQFDLAAKELTRRGFDIEVNYAQSTQLDGRVLFSALIIAREPVAAA
ncbi:hypothetical protein [Paenibacillus sp. FSL K6-2859]|uniref:hypothetical protein n=1 Tax=Paenibacillus sp. FSL K6-2859 TaxID=2921482 RepID=UPI0030F9C050